MASQASTWGAQSMNAVYVRRDAAGLVYGGSVDELVEGAKEPLTVDWRAWACQFCFGYPLGRRTHFEQISMLRPGETELPEAGGDAAFGAAATPAAAARAPKITELSPAVAGVAERLLAAVARCLSRSSNKQPICFLSGGWASRAIAACLARLVPGADFDTFTTSFDGGNDCEERFAEQVAAALGLRHRVLALDTGYYPRHAPPALLAADFATDMHVWMSDLLAKVAGEKKLVNFDGYAGDLLLRGLVQEAGDDLRPPNDPIFFERFSAVITPTSVLSGPIAKTFERLARDELARELAYYPADRRLLHFALNNRGWRAIAHSVRLQERSIDVELPFLDPELVEFVLSVDDSVRLSPQFYPAILSALDQRLAGLPSTNDVPLPAGWSVRPIEKHSSQTQAWYLDNIREYATSPADSGGVIDWYSVEPAKKAHQVGPEWLRRRHLRALEMTNLHALWLKRYQGRIRTGHVLDYALEESGGLSRSVPVTVNHETDFDGVARRYLERAKSLAGASLRFHLTMDVEAFPITDDYAHHTAATELIPTLIYGDLGDGSEIDELLLRQRVPCTYFLEAYSPVWSSGSALADAARFFKNEFTELGLHCHAFSVTDALKRELGLASDWFLQPRALASVLRDGKVRLEAAIGEPLQTYRSGRLDVYPELERAVAEAGLTIDSSLADGHDAYYYADRASQIGNGVHRRGGVVEVPITAYRARGRSRILDFNGSSFEDMCFVVVRALELGLPSVTMLMHSWSLSELDELPLLAKGFHRRKSPALREKLQRWLEFLHALGCVQLSTLRDTVAESPVIATLPSFPPANFELVSSKPG